MKTDGVSPEPLQTMETLDPRVRELVATLEPRFVMLQTMETLDPRVRSPRARIAE